MAIDNPVPAFSKAATTLIEVILHIQKEPRELSFQPRVRVAQHSVNIGGRSFLPTTLFGMFEKSIPASSSKIRSASLMRPAVIDISFPVLETDGTTSAS